MTVEVTGWKLRLFSSLWKAASLAQASGFGFLFRASGAPEVLFFWAKNDHLGDPIAPVVSHRFGMSWVLKCGWLVMAGRPKNQISIS